MDAVDLLEILSDASNVELLLHHDKNFGIKIVDECGKAIQDNCCIDLGDIYYNSLPSTNSEDVPLGYEDDEIYNTSIKKCRSKNMILHLMSANDVILSNDNLSKTDRTFIIENHKLLPTNDKTNPSYVISLVEKKGCNNDNREITGIQFTVTITIENNYVGTLNRLLLFQIKSYRKLNAVTFESITFLSAIQIIGTVKPHDAVDLLQPVENVEKKISIEAPPFVPLSSLGYFDCMGEVVAFTEDIQLSLVLPPVPVFQRLQQFYNQCTLNPQSIGDYIIFFRQNNLNGFLTKYGLHDILSNLESDYAIEMTPARYVKNLDTLMRLEEMHSQMEIAQFGLQLQMIDFSIYQGMKNNVTMNQIDQNHLNMIQAKFTFKGSNELRPKISIGDTIRLKAASDSSSNPIELRGLVSSYLLINEMVTVVFASRISILELRKYRYHIRYEFDRTGFVFIYNALHYIKQNEFIQAMLFPKPEAFEQTLEKIGQRDAMYDKEGPIKKEHQIQYPSLNNLNVDQMKVVEYILKLVDLQPKMKLFNNSLLEIRESMAALGTSAIPIPPFVVFGPPGTGKTRTLIETILVLTRKYPNLRILACAPSDPACDVICERLAQHFTPQELFRFNWWQRIPSSVHHKIKSYCYQTKDGLYSIYDQNVMESFQVIVSTCGCAGTLSENLNFVQNPSLQFDVIIVDEASQATEAEVFVPLGLCKLGGVMVLAGDTNQLGPITRSPVFRTFNHLPQSMQNRLLSLPKYEDCLPFHMPRSSQNQNIYATNVQSIFSKFKDRLKKWPADEMETTFQFGVFLSKNYRSNERILEISSKLFYGNTLKACGKPSMINCMLDWEELPNSSFPLLFYGVKGQHAHDIDSPSYYNLKEVDEVSEICQMLINSKKISLDWNDIGVIAGYRNQVLRIRNKLRTIGLNAISVGSVEDFQGQEKKVIVISTVLSHWLNRLDHQGGTGLIGDPKRFNVSITRGVALCVVVGHPDLLYSDPYWREIMRYCERNGSYKGLRSSIMEKDEQNYQNADDDDQLLNDVAKWALQGRSIQKEETVDLGSGYSHEYAPLNKNIYYDLPWKYYL